MYYETWCDRIEKMIEAKSKLDTKSELEEGNTHTDFDPGSLRSHKMYNQKCYLNPFLEIYQILLRAKGV